MVGRLAVGRRAVARTAPVGGEGLAAPPAAQGDDDPDGAAAGGAGTFGRAGVQGLETSTEVTRGVAVADASADPARQVDGAGRAGEAAPAGLTHRQGATGSRIIRAAAPTGAAGHELAQHPDVARQLDGALVAVQRGDRGRIVARSDGRGRNNGFGPGERAASSRNHTSDANPLGRSGGRLQGCSPWPNSTPQSLSARVAPYSCLTSATMHEPGRTALRDAPPRRPGRTRELAATGEVVAGTGRNDHHRHLVPGGHDRNQGQSTVPTGHAITSAPPATAASARATSCSPGCNRTG